MIRQRAATAFVSFFALAQTAQAHDLWLVIDAKGGENGSANLYFAVKLRDGRQHLLPALCLHRRASALPRRPNVL